MAIIYNLIYCVVLVCCTYAHTQHDPPMPVSNDALSEHQHFGDSGEHDTSYDHDMFLGRDEARNFENLDPKIAKNKLREIAKKIDVNKDGKINAQEIENWIEGNMKRYAMKNTNDRLKKWDTNNDEHVSWSEYIAIFSGSNLPKKDRLKSDERRFDKADMNGDGLLSREELTFFLHPEESHLMTDVIAEENLEALDTNNDGEVSLKEFAGDSHGKLTEALVNGVASHFTQLDTNKDGKLNKEELIPWVVPNEANTISNEAMHLLSQADGNMDHVLSYDEMVNKYEAFVGSKATHYGDLLKPNPDL